MGTPAAVGCLLPRTILQIFKNLYAILLNTWESQSSSGDDLHYCSLQHPCAVASAVFSPLYGLRLVSKDWESCFILFCSLKENRFFRRVEDVYYPHVWHINTKIRKAVLIGRYRVFNTIDTEDGERGVFQAMDCKASKHGCVAGRTVIVKGWLNSADSECATEGYVYRTLQSAKAVNHVPALLANAFDESMGVHALVVEKLGPTLEDLLRRMPGRKLTERLVLAAAIQMIDCYADLHSAGIIHNGVKPGNICISSNADGRSQLKVIDFGLSYLLEDSGNANTFAMPKKVETVGNRQFLSLYGHHGISQSQRDDLESLGYLFSFLFHGSLPWDYTSLIHTKSRRRPGAEKDNVPVNKLTPPTTPHIWCIKMATPGRVLFRDMDPCFLHYWKDIRSLAFGEKPDYAHLKSLFVECWRTRQLRGDPGEVDWLCLWETGQEERT
ncbi:hypothetical protein D9613_003441 [Agrocybe pediades]|uniref:Protein kinase domain-containing protein n=1 Tax=Agrocybe pediades TaxID=84607 RepID=A0A8H4QP62_9AGAR|nr:hypothetical protein D9613_003441 [Agrocybe pediades]